MCVQTCFCVYLWRKCTCVSMHVGSCNSLCHCMWSLRRENGSGVCLDLQVIDTVPGAKIEEELETHHVLAGNLYKPRRRVQNVPHSHPLTIKCSEAWYCISKMGDTLYDVFASVDIPFSVPAVPVPLQSPLHDSGWKRETGQGGVPEEYAQPTGVL